MSSRICSWRIGYARLDYVRPVHWAAHSEIHGDCFVLEVADTDGMRGAAEAIVRPKWHDIAIADIENSLTLEVLPALARVDWSVPASAQDCLRRACSNGFVRALADQALWDLRGKRAGLPLWKLLGAQSPIVPVSYTLTRSSPDAMAREAAQMRARHGFTDFKVKTGQGIDIDRRAIAEIRAAVGADAAIMADSNRAHDISEVAAMSAMLADAGVLYFEDPCAFLADGSFLAARAASVLPILVDNQCRSIDSGHEFLRLGARALSLKTMKTGITDSCELAQATHRQGCKLAVGISASGGGGAIHTLSLAAAMPADAVCLACEETFFLNLQRDILNAPLRVSAGAVELPGEPSFAELIDWRAMQRNVAGVV